MEFNTATHARAYDWYRITLRIYGRKNARTCWAVLTKQTRRVSQFRVCDKWGNYKNEVIFAQTSEVKMLPAAENKKYGGLEVIEGR